jgi:hypothetical protein
MLPFLGRLLFGGFFRTAATVGTAGYFANKATNGALVEKVVAPVFSAATNAAGNAASSATDSLLKNFDPMKLLGDHWDKLGLGAAVAGTIWGSGMIRNLSIGILLCTAAYMAYKHFFAPKEEFNTVAPAVEGAPSVATPTNLKLVAAPTTEAPKEDVTQTGFNRQTAAPQPLVRLNVAGGTGAKVEEDKPVLTNE